MTKNKTKSRPEDADSVTLPDRQLIYSRTQAAKLLGNVSTMTIVRLEKKGALKAVRPFSRSGQVFYSHADLIKIVNAREDERRQRPTLGGALAHHDAPSRKALRRKSVEG
jgi:hypothetical protein